MKSYNQEIKISAREKLISHAIESLTKQNDQSCLVTEESFSKITDHFNNLLSRVFGSINIDFLNQYNELFFGGKNSWLDFYRNHTQSKKASELKILYLSGPEPFNDIEVFCNYGIRLENIWAIESDKKIYDQALQSLKDQRVFIKIHRGTLEEFFRLTNHEFDIIYFDACSPIFSPQQSPLEILKQIFLNKRLTGLSVLITNFAEPHDNYNWGEILAAWFANKEMDLPKEEDNFGRSSLEKSSDLSSYGSHINQHLDSYYDLFLSQFIPTLAAEIIPMWQFCSLGSIQSNHLLNEHALLKELKLIRNPKIKFTNLSDLFTELPHFYLAVDSYPLLNWSRLIKENFSKEHILNKFICSNRGKITIEDSLYVMSLLKGFEEADSGFKTFIHNVCGENLKNTLANLDFFDRHLRITCDIPMKNLFVELLLGLYGYPYIAHAGKSISIKYKAKETWMYSNVFVFDQCRYLYDYLPTIDLWQSFFQNYASQIIVRGCIDQIRRNHLYINSSLFKWGFIEGITDEFSASILKNRINLNEKQ